MAIGTSVRFYVKHLVIVQYAHNLLQRFAAPYNSSTGELKLPRPLKFDRTFGIDL